MQETEKNEDVDEEEEEEEEEEEKEEKDKKQIVKRDNELLECEIVDIIMNVLEIFEKTEFYFDKIDDNKLSNSENYSI
jgi:TATA-binding protein-associated factor Taf7